MASRAEVSVALVVLAGGRASRFGGDKPLASVGPHGEAVMDYTIHDASRSGFAPILVVVRSATRAAMERHLQEHHPDREFGIVVQDADRCVPTRAKPWGTVHAVVAARSFLDGPFAVVNADDLYGSSAMQLLMDVTTANPAADHLVGYRWKRTIPPHRTANRGVCSIDSAGRLTALVEMREISGGALDPDAVVSMNLWGFRRDAMAELRRDLEVFVAAHEGDAEAELALPEAIGARLSSREPVFVHVTEDEWTGVTYPDDVEWARDRVRQLIQSGRYPERLSSGY